MSLDIIKPLLESGIINEDTSIAINEAWEAKLNEARDQVRAELREEFAGKYEHDRMTMVEALDKMITESLQGEISEFEAERRAINEDRANAAAKLRESASKFNEFMVTKLAEEIKEMRSDRAAQFESQSKLEKFVVHALAREIKDFSADRQAVVEARVKLVAEGTAQLNKLKAQFVAESAKKLNESVTKHLKGEISQLKEDITVARQNSFGRAIFETFASEFSATHLNEKAETKKLMNKLARQQAQLAESAKKISAAQRLVESKEREVRIIKESNLREKTLAELLSPLNEEKAGVMKDLLESVQTPKLQAAFDKYLPAVLNNGSAKKARATLSESRSEVTGDKQAAKHVVDVEERDNVIDIKRLAGL